MTAWKAVRPGHVHDQSRRSRRGARCWRQRDKFLRHLRVPNGVRLEDLTFARAGNDLRIGLAVIENYFAHDASQTVIGRQTPWLIERLQVILGV